MMMMMTKVKRMKVMTISSFFLLFKFMSVIVALFFEHSKLQIKLQDRDWWSKE
jgi:hypothetical protein